MDSAMPTRKYGYKNIYTCPECGGQTVTIDVDEGVSEYQKLSRQMRDHVDEGGLDIRRKRGYVNPDEEIKGYFRDSHGSLRKKSAGVH